MKKKNVCLIMCILLLVFLLTLLHFSKYSTGKKMFTRIPSSKYDLIVLKWLNVDPFKSEKQLSSAIEFWSIKLENNKSIKRELIYTFYPQDDCKFETKFLSFDDTTLFTDTKNRAYYLTGRCDDSTCFYRFHFDETEQIKVKKIADGIKSVFWPISAIDSSEQFVLDMHGNMFNIIENTFLSFGHPVYFEEIPNNDNYASKTAFVGASTYVDDNSIAYVYPTTNYDENKSPHNVLVKLSLNTYEIKTAIWGFYPLRPFFRNDDYSLPLDVSKTKELAFISYLANYKNNVYELWLSIWDFNTDKVYSVVKLSEYDLAKDGQPQFLSLFINPIINWNLHSTDIIAIAIDNLWIIDTKKKTILSNESIGQIISMRWSNSGNRLGLLSRYNYSTILNIYNKDANTHYTIDVDKDALEEFWNNCVDIIWVD